VAEKQKGSESLEAVQDLLLKAPTEPLSYVMLARALVREGDIPRAQKALQAARHLAPDDLRVWLLQERLDSGGQLKGTSTTLSDAGRAEAAWWQARSHLSAVIFGVEILGLELEPEPEELAEFERHCHIATTVSWPRQADSQLLEVARLLLIDSWPEAAELLTAVAGAGLPVPPERWEPPSAPSTSWPAVAALAAMLALHGDEGGGARRAQSALAAIGVPATVMDEDGHVTIETINLLLGALRPIPFNAPLPPSNGDVELLRWARENGKETEALRQRIQQLADDLSDTSIQRRSTVSVEGRPS
jgi:hypothetical protein